MTRSAEDEDKRKKPVKKVDFNKVAAGVVQVETAGEKGVFDV